MVCLDFENNLWVTLGVPIDTEGYIPGISKIRIPNDPHIFMVHQLYVQDSKHKETLLENVPVIMAHGYRDNDIWRFANRQPVTETVVAFNKYAKGQGLPSLEFVIACNKEVSNPLNIKIKDLPVTEDPIVQSVDKDITLWLGHKSQVSDRGRVMLTIENQGEFWGLDKLILYKRISILR